MSEVLLCRADYRRPNGSLLMCQFLLDHPAEHHSWWTLSVADAAAAEAKAQREAVAATLDTTPVGVQALLDALTTGKYDQWLEALLAVAHGRKRALRGTPGFARGGVVVRVPMLLPGEHR